MMSKYLKYWQSFDPLKCGVDDQAISSMAQLKTIIDEAQPGTKIKLEII